KTRARSSTCAARDFGSPTETQVARSATEAEHRVVYRDPHAYVAHPHAVVLPDGTWLCVFNQSVRRHLILHPPQDPFFANFLIRSDDRGSTWSAPVIVPDYGWHGMECAGLTALADG